MNGHFLFLEPFFGGSHRAFAEGLIAHSRHHIDLRTLPERFWKWRMRGAALHFAQAVDPGGYDGLIVSDLLSLSDLKALWGQRCPPSLVYFHENQLTYPLAPGERMDYQFGFTDITTALAADRILFNSESHYRAFFASLPRFLKLMPEYRPRWIVPAIREKASILYPGCDLESSEPPGAEKRPLIIWNHRWEFDKNPRAFFDSLDAVLARGAEFDLALLGRNYQKVPQEFIAARKRLGQRIVQYGYVEDRDAYWRWLRRGSVVVSTADQENFGMAMVEAMASACAPLLPNRLSYPELLPPRFHRFLYTEKADLADRLFNLLQEVQNPSECWQETIGALAASMQRFAWPQLIEAYDAELTALAQTAGE